MFEHAKEVNLKLTSKELAQQFNTTHTSITSSLHKLKISKLRKCFFCDLNDVQQNQRLNVCTSLISRKKSILEKKLLLEIKSGFFTTVFSTKDNN